MNEQQAQDAGAGQAERRNGFEQALAAIVAITRRKWMTCAGEPMSTDAAAVDRIRIGRLSLSVVLDAKQGRC